MRRDPDDPYAREGWRRLDRLDLALVVGFVLVAFFFRLWQLDIPRHTHFDESVPSSVLHRGFETPGGFVQYSMPWTRGDVRNRVADGTCDLGLTDSDDALSAMERGKPVDFIVPDQTAEWRGAFLIPNSVALLKNSTILRRSIAGSCPAPARWST